MKLPINGVVADLGAAAHAAEGEVVEAADATPPRLFCPVFANSGQIATRGVDLRPCAGPVDDVVGVVVVVDGVEAGRAPIQRGRVAPQNAARDGFVPRVVVVVAVDEATASNFWGNNFRDLVPCIQTGEGLGPNDPIGVHLLQPLTLHPLYPLNNPHRRLIIETLEASLQLNFGRLLSLDVPLLPRPELHGLDLEVHRVGSGDEGWGEMPDHGLSEHGHFDHFALWKQKHIPFKWQHFIKIRVIRPISTITNLPPKLYFEMCILPSSNFEQSINALLTLAQFKNYQTCQENEPGFPTCLEACTSL